MHDVIVIGGGPAGTTTAINLAENGIRVLILDKISPSEIRRSGEYIPKMLLLNESNGRGAIVHEVEGLVVLLPEHQEDFIHAPGYIIDRKIFNTELLNIARASGCEIRFPASASINGSEILISQNGRPLDARASLYVGADGSKLAVEKKVESL